MPRPSLKDMLNLKSSGKPSRSPRGSLKDEELPPLRRYTEKGYDLDLTYVTDRIIVMPTPVGKKGYGNRIDDLKAFLQAKHSDRYRIWSLDESWDHTKLAPEKKIRTDLRPVVLSSDWGAYYTPPLACIISICSQIQEWLELDNENVAIIQDELGLGGSGSIACSFMLFDKLFKSAENATEFFAERRLDVMNEKEVRFVFPFPSQLRSVSNVERMTQGFRPIRQPIAITRISVNKAMAERGVYVKIYQDSQSKEVWNGNKLQMSECLSPETPILVSECPPLLGDITIRLKRYTKPDLSTLKSSVFIAGVQFHSGFIDYGVRKLSFTKDSLDFPSVSSKYSFPEDFVLTVEVEGRDINELDVRGVWPWEEDEVSQVHHGPQESQSHIISKRGFLTKLGKTVKNWKTRFFIQTNDLLQYYVKQEDTRPKGTIDVKQCTVIRRPDIEDSFAFDVCPKHIDRIYTLLANDQLDMLAWITSISHFAELVVLNPPLAERLDLSGDDGASNMPLIDGKLYRFNSSTEEWKVCYANISKDILRVRAHTDDLLEGAGGSIIFLNECTLLKESEWDKKQENHMPFQFCLSKNDSGMHLYFATELKDMFDLWSGCVSRSCRTRAPSRSFRHPKIEKRGIHTIDEKHDVESSVSQDSKLMLSVSDFQRELKTANEKAEEAPEEAIEDAYELTTRAYSSECEWRTFKSMSANNTVVHSGYLVKQGGIVANWKVRYFVLTNEFIAYYKSAHDLTPLRTLSLQNCQVFDIPQEKFDRKFCFGIRIPSSNRVFYVLAASDEKREMWMDKINFVISKL